MTSVSASTVISCRWDWCRYSFNNIDALDAHVKREHIWPMKPLRKADIALMRRMDFQSFHSSPNTDSSIISRGISSPSVWSGLWTGMTLEPVAGVSQAKTPPPAAPPTSILEAQKRSENEMLDTFAQLSSPLQTHSPQRPPALPALESPVGQVEHELSAAVAIFERARGHNSQQRLSSPFRQPSPMHRPLSNSSGSSQEVVEQQLTQEDDVGSQSLFPLGQIENEHDDVELRWPTDDVSDVLVTEGIQDSDFGSGSLNVAPGVNNQSTGLFHTSQRSFSQSPPMMVLQTQAPYSSQATGWSQTQ